MTTLTQMIAAARQPLVVRWELVTDARGRTRPEMRWTATPETSTRTADQAVTLAA